MPSILKLKARHEHLTDRHLKLLLLQGRLKRVLGAIDLHITNDKVLLRVQVESLGEQRKPISLIQLQRLTG